LDQSNFQTLDIFSLALVMYFILAHAINLGMRSIERRLARGRMRGGLS
jgi:polar amino acid transport system permease protein